AVPHLAMYLCRYQITTDIHTISLHDALPIFIKRPPQTHEMAIAHIQLLDDNLKNDKGISWGITTKDSNELIGNICLWNFSEDKRSEEHTSELQSRENLVCRLLLEKKKDKKKK